MKKTKEEIKRIVGNRWVIGMGPVVFKATGLFLFFIFINIITSKELTMKNS